MSLPRCLVSRSGLPGLSAFAMENSDGMPAGSPHLKAGLSSIPADLYATHDQISMLYAIT